MVVFIVFGYLLLSCILAFIVHHYTRGNIANLVKEPIALALSVLILIHGVMPPLQYMTKFYRYGQEYTLFTHFYSICIVLIFALTMVAFYAITFRKVDLEPVELFPISAPGKIYLLFFVIIPSVVAAFLFFASIRSFGYDNYMRDRIDFNDRYGGLTLFFCHWIYISFFVCVAGFLSSMGRDKSMLHWAIALGLITTGYFGYIGSRHSIFIAFAVAMGIYCITTWRPHISLWRLLLSTNGLVLIFMVVAVVIVGNIRATMIGLRTDDSSIQKVVRSLNGGYGNHENVTWLIQNNFECMYGRTYLAGIINVFPRVFWANKPVGAGPIMKNLVDPGSYEIGKHGISSLTTGMVTESYMNGGFLGVVIVAAVTGMVLKFIASFRPRCNGPWSVTIYTYSVFIFAYCMTYGEFLGIYTRWLIDSFPLVIGFFMFEYRRDYLTSEENLVYAEQEQEFQYQ